MSSSDPKQPSQHVERPESKTLTQETSDPDTKTAELQQNSAENKTISEGDPERSTEDGGEEEEGECGFCLFMKGGGCKETFVEWEKCVDEAEDKKEDIVEKCFQATSALKKCMEAHSDYYAPVLQAEKAAEAEAQKQRSDNQGGGEESENKEALGGSDPKK